MQKELSDYVKWLGSYKEKWNEESSPEELKMYEHGLQSLLKHEGRDPERLEILRMISLLQNNVWVEVDGGNGSL